MVPLFCLYIVCLHYANSLLLTTRNKHQWAPPGLHYIVLMPKMGVTVAFVALLSVVGYSVSKCLSLLAEYHWACCSKALGALDELRMLMMMRKLLLRLPLMSLECFQSMFHRRSLQKLECIALHYPVRCNAARDLSAKFH